MPKSKPAVKPPKKGADVINLTIRLPLDQMESLRKEARHELVSITSLIRRKLFPPTPTA